MNVKQAVAASKKYLVDLFEDEPPIQHLALEEVEFDEPTRTWLVTLGFFRPWEEQRVMVPALNLSIPREWKRAYKVVRVSDGNGAVLSVKDREFQS